MTDGENMIEELKEVLEKEAEKPSSDIPNHSRCALEDDHVQEALKSRFEDDETLSDIRSLGYSFRTGVTNTVFTFERKGIDLGSTGVLVMTDSKCDVVGLIEDFDIDQSNKRPSPSPEKGDKPFALRRPSAADRLVFTSEELAPVKARFQKYFDERDMPIFRPREDEDENEDDWEGDDEDDWEDDEDEGWGGTGGWGGSWRTKVETEYGTQQGTQSETCIRWTGYLVPSCDESVTQYVVDEVPDYTTDYVDDTYA